MYCPHCNEEIPEGSNFCPQCYADLSGAGMRDGYDDPDMHGAAEERRVRSGTSRRKNTYGRGSRRRKADRTPMMIAIGLVLILIVIIALIVRSMLSAGDRTPSVQRQTSVPTSAAQQATPGPNFIVFGATNTPAPRIEVTATPQIEVTATPQPVPQTSEYKTLRKGDEGVEVMTMQLALTQLGYLNGAADGNFGTGTQNAVKQFQEDNDLYVDGIAGKMTLELLYTRSSVTPMPEVTVGPGDILDLPG